MLYAALFGIVIPTDLQSIMPAAGGELASKTGSRNIFRLLFGTGSCFVPSCACKTTRANSLHGGASRLWVLG